jgi:hypothetical protein
MRSPLEIVTEILAKKPFIHPLADRVLLPGSAWNDTKLANLRAHIECYRERLGLDLDKETVAKLLAVRAALAEVAKPGRATNAERVEQFIENSIDLVETRMYEGGLL